MRYVLILACLPLWALGQPSTGPKKIEFFDYLADRIYHGRTCMQSVMVKLEALEKKPSTYVASVQCIGQPDPYTYNQAAPSANKDVANAWSIYNDLFKTNEELISYIRLEEHKKDAGRTGMDLIESIAEKALRLNKIRDALTTAIYAKRNNITSVAYNKAYALMIEAIVHEEKVLQHLNEEYQHVPAGKFNEQFLIQSYLETDALLNQLGAVTVNLHPAGSYLRSFISAIKDLQDLKQTGVDNNSYPVQKSTAEADALYDYYLNHFNNNLLSFFRLFAKNAGGASYPKYFSAFRLHDYPITVTIKPKPYAAVESKALIPVAQSKAIPLHSFTALNHVVIALNERTRSLSNVQSSLRSFESSFEYVKVLDLEKQKSYKFSFGYQNFIVPEIDLASIRRDLPKAFPAYNEALLPQLLTIQEIMLEYERLLEELSVYLEEKLYLENGYDRGDEILKRLNELSDIYLEKKEGLYRSVRSVYFSYMNAQTNNPWMVSAAALLEATDHTSEALRDVKKKFFPDQTNTNLSLDLIATDRVDLIKNQSVNMAGIERLGPGHGHCPYTPYERVPDYIKTFSEKTFYIDSYIEKGQLSHYEDFTNMYNNIVEAHNKFAELGRGDIETAKGDKNRPVYILYCPATFAPYYRNIKTPALASTKRTNKEKENRRVEEENLPPVTVTQGLSTGNTSSSFSNTKEITHVIHTKETIYDTIYIEHSRTDTIYVYDGRPSSDESFEGYPVNNLVFLLDVSGSMNRPDKLPVLKEAIRYLVGLMRKEDEISIVTYSGKAKVALKPTSATAIDKIDEVIRKLYSDGKTNANDGIRLAYKLAEENYVRGGNNRIIMATDGEISVGTASIDMITTRAYQDIPLTVFAFGDPQQPQNTLERMAQAGMGNFIHVSRDNIKAKLIHEAKAKK